MAQSNPDLFAPAEIGPVTLRDRTIKAATCHDPSGAHRVLPGYAA